MKSPRSPSRWVSHPQRVECGLSQRDEHPIEGVAGLIVGADDRQEPRPTVIARARRKRHAVMTALPFGPGQHLQRGLMAEIGHQRDAVALAASDVVNAVVLAE